MDAELAGKVALITGAARGIGEATARRMVDLGARVVVADVLVDEAKAVAADLGDASTSPLWSHGSPPWTSGRTSSRSSATAAASRPSWTPASEHPPNPGQFPAPAPDDEETSNVKHHGFYYDTGRETGTTLFLCSAAPLFTHDPATNHVATVRAVEVDVPAASTATWRTHA